MVNRDAFVVFTSVLTMRLAIRTDRLMLDTTNPTVSKFDELRARPAQSAVVLVGTAH